ADLPGPGGGVALTGAAIEIEGWEIGCASDWSMERGLPFAIRSCSDVPSDFGSGELVGIFSGTG
ncbi:hypothetical protein JZU48_00375, partial [bacterium]|nr:hypothetical protein [bacterium]